ncbi:MAG TPA: hypothetical protein VLK82_10920 [Candidatus Tectomicrobia bacterium]|nr:hypothetical protein [Candidatus Tectomicrobia bacterium]
MKQLTEKGPKNQVCIDISAAHDSLGTNSHRHPIMACLPPI